MNKRPRLVRMFSVNILVSALFLGSGCGGVIFRAKSPPTLPTNVPAPLNAPSMSMESFDQSKLPKPSVTTAAVHEIPNLKENYLGISSFQIATQGHRRARMEDIVSAAAPIVEGFLGKQIPFDLNTLVQSVKPIFSGFKSALGMKNAKKNEAKLNGARFSVEPLSQPDDMINSALSYLETLLPMKLLSKGYAKVIYPDVLRSIAVEIDNKGAATNQKKITWKSSLSNMVFIDKVTKANYILYGDFLSLNLVPKTFNLSYTYDKQEMAAYQKRWTQFKSQAQEYQQSLETTYQNYKQEFNTWKNRYEGRLEEQADIAKWNEIKQQNEAFDAQYEQLKKDYQLAVQKTVTPKSFLSMISSKTGEQTIKVIDADLIVKLLDVNSGETFWMQRIKYSHPVLENVVQGILDTIIDGLGTKAVATADPQDVALASTLKK